MANVKGKMDEGRHGELRAMLEELLTKFRTDTRDKVRRARPQDGDRRIGATDDDPPEDLERGVILATAQVASEMASAVGQALARLEEGAYGFCCDCDDDISPARLRALPFAVRCTDCERIREQGKEWERRETPTSLFLQ